MLICCGIYLRTNNFKCFINEVQETCFSYVYIVSELFKNTKEA